MSMENAILELAASIRYLADSNRRDLTDSAALIAKSTPVADMVQGNATDEVYARAAGAIDKKMAAAPVLVKDKEIEQAVQKVEEAAAKKNAPAAPAPAVSAAPTTSAPAADSEAPALDYAKDVRPVLLQVIKKPGLQKPAVERLLAEYGVKNADQLPPASFAEIIAKAQALLAA